MDMPLSLPAKSRLNRLFRAAYGPARSEGFEGQRGFTQYWGRLRTKKAKRCSGM